MSKVSTIAPVPHFTYFPNPRDDLHKLETAKFETAKLILSTISQAFPECKLTAESVDAVNEVANKVVRPSVPGRGELSLPCFVFNKKLDASFALPPPAMAAKLGETINQALEKQSNQFVERVEVAAAYLNIYLTPSFLASVLPIVLDGSYLKRLANIGQPRTMVEYSQPNCFPVGNHEILTSEGFMLLQTMQQKLANGGTVQIACPLIDGRLQYHSIKNEDVIVADGEFRIINFKEKSVNCNRTVADVSIDSSTSNQMDISVTANHRMYVRIGTNTDMDRNEYEIMPAGDIIGKIGHPNSSLVVQFQANASKGVAPPNSNLPFVEQLGLDTTDKTDAFLELYGYWLGNGWLDTRGRIAFCPIKAHDWDYLDGLFDRLELPLLAESKVGQLGYWRQSDRDFAGKCIYYITGDAWCSLFAVEYGRKYGLPATATGDMSTKSTPTSSPSSTPTSSRNSSRASSPERMSRYSAFSLRDEEDDLIQDLQSADIAPPNIKSAKWFSWWVFHRLDARQLRLVFVGLRFADGDQAGASDTTGWIATSSVVFRDQVMQAAIRAGYSVYFREHNELDQANIGWRVYYSDDDHAARPKLDILSQVTEEPYTGAVWCVSVPTPEQLIFVRKVIERNDQGIVVKASRPVIVGNTHKAFHVGHMRNAALGDCLVRLYEQMGHEVIAANYFGDEGAHVAKCLWWLKRFLQENPSFDLDSVPVAERGEFLGQFYSDSVEQLDLATLTAYPFESIVPAKVLAINPHPDVKAPKNWRVVTLQASEDAADTRTVVCGGIGYEVGSHVAYMPLGAKVKNVIVAEKDMMGVMSVGIMMAEKELGIEPKVEEVKAEEKGKKPAKGAKKDAGVTDAASQRIHQFPTSLPLGQPVVEAGRLPNAKISAPTVIEEWRIRKEEVRKCLRDMEGGDEEMVAFWQKTRQWSLDEFKRIYAWLNCRFDHDFFESEVSEASRLMVEQHRDVFIDSNGATGADLSKFGLGFCMVLKSDGSGLYATKDLALAKRKFDQFKIEESIYIVDAAQTLHFKQVFKTLELMGYEQAKKCIHLPYGQVVLPSGKMSSRAGNVILFSQLRQQLTQDIYEKFLASKTTAGKARAVEAEQSADGAAYVKSEREPVVWSEAELLNAQHAIAVASIKYGMLNHDTAKDIVFVMEEWTAKSGNTGPYMLYAYARIQSIIGGVQSLHPHLINTSSTISPELIGLLTHETERIVLTQILDFWTVVEACTVNNNPSALCSYLFDLSKGFSGWYEKCSLLHAENDQIREARLRFITTIGMVIKQGLNLLGITTLDRM